MALELNRTSVFTAKYLDAGGVQKFVDIMAVGMTEAKDKFKVEYPGCQVINMWRKQ
jgi:ribosomal protein L18E